LNKNKKSINGSRILFLGVAYKPDINDERESPALEILDIIANKGGIVSYNDPFIPKIKTHEGLVLNSVELSIESLRNADLVVVTTKHSLYDGDFVSQHANLIVDLRNLITYSNTKTFKL
ncbi:MAG: UDP binding domain-containing protein, partial [Bacteroidales bacterium]|nr:UDP binding domain-containing protein [Bacteroidales bacterium]